MILASGKESDFYVDCRQVTLHGVGTVLVGKIIYKILLDIRGSYLRLFNGTESRIYLQKYLPCVILFYQTIDKKLLSKVCTVLLSSLRNVFGNEEIDECLI